MFYASFKFWLCALCLTFFQFASHAQIFVTNTSSPKTVTLAWDPSPDSAAIGYFLQYGFTSGGATNRLDVGNVSTVTLGGLLKSTTYHFTVLAYSATGLESVPSNEIDYSTPASYEQVPLIFETVSSQIYGTTNQLSASGGSGGGALNYRVASGPGMIVEGSKLVATSGTGIIEVVATKAGDVDYEPISATNTVNTAKASQTISFGMISNQKTTNIISLAATASSGLAVSFDVVSGPGIVSGNLLTFTDVGSVLVAARQSGSAAFNPAQAVTNTVSVIQVVWPSIVLETNLLSFSSIYGGTAPAAQKLKFTNTGEVISDYTNIVTFSSGASNWFTLSPSFGTITPYGSLTTTGAVMVSALRPGIYFATNLVISRVATNTSLQWVAQLTVSKAAQLPLVFELASPQSYGATNFLSVKGGSGTGITTYTVVSGPGLIVNGTNLVITSGTGSITVNAVKAADSYYEAAQTSLTIAATTAPQQPLLFDPITPQVYGATNILTTRGGSGAGVVSYSVISGPGRIVDGNKLVMTSGTGTVGVSARKAADVNYSSSGATNTVLATKASQTIVFGTISPQRMTNVVNLAAAASSGLTVSFDVLSGPGIVSGSRLSFTDGGSVVVAARQAGNMDFTPAQAVTNTVIVISPLAPPSNLRVFPR